MKVVLAIKSVIRPVGGAERSLTELADELLSRGHEVQIVIHEDGARDIEARPFYPLSPSIRIQNIAPRRSASEASTGRKRSAVRRLVPFRRIWKDLKKERRLAPDSALLTLQEALRTMSWFRRLERKRWLRSKQPVVARWREKIEELQPDVVVAFMPPCFTYLSQALKGGRFSFVICYRNDPHIDHTPGRYVNNSHDAQLRREAYEIADTVCVQLEVYKGFFPEEVQHKIVCIPNIVMPATNELSPLRPPSREDKIILSVGRLAPAKNHELLLRSFHRIHRDFPDWRIEIYGKGKLETRLRRLARKLGIEEEVGIHSPVRNIEAAYRTADILAFPSKWEGFSRAHSEAMAHGLPSVGLRECRYSREMLTESGAGLLSTDDPEEFSDRLRELMANESLRRVLGERAVEHVKNFNPKVIFDHWENTLLRTVAGNGRADRRG